MADFMRSDEELDKLVKEWVAVLKKQFGKVTQKEAIKIALRKVLLK